MLYYDTTNVVLDTGGHYLVNESAVPHTLDSSLIQYWKACYDTFKKLPVYLKVTYKAETLMGIRGNTNDAIRLAQDTLVAFIKANDTGVKKR